MCSGAITAAEKGHAHPILIPVKNAYAFREPRGTSWGNSHYIHFGIKALLWFMERNPDTTGKGVVILSPYLTLCALWLEAIEGHEELRGVRADTPESMQGWRKRFALWDTLCARNVNGTYSWLADLSQIRNPLI